MRRSQTVALLLVLAAHLVGAPNLVAQEAAYPRVVWELATWPSADPNGVPQSQGYSGEDWFYSITRSMTAGAVHDGFVAAGYSTYPTLTTTTCRSTLECDSDYGCSHGTIGR